MNETTVQAVLRAARLLFQAGDVVEVRVPKAGRLRTVSGYFDDFELLAQAVASLEFAKYPGVYWTLNPVDRALLARAANKTKGYAEETTKDDHIVTRHWLPVDFDPIRPTGISSSDSEHAAALDLAHEAAAALRADGWPDPIKADSGNGAHLLYAVDLPNDDAAADLLKRVLEGMAKRFGTASVDVDRKNFNAARIFKAYGTTARKGDHTPERPHRLSHVFEAPESFTTVSLELLNAQAASAPPKPGPSRSTPYRGAARNIVSFEIEDFLRRHNLAYWSPVPFEGGLKYVLLECPFDSSHKAPDSAIFDRPDGLGFTCFHNSCHGRDWRALREMLEGPRPVRTFGPELPPARDEDAPPANRSPRVWVGEPAAVNGSAAPERAVAVQNSPPEPPAGGEEESREPPDLIDYPLTDSGNGQRIVAMFGKNIRYCMEMKHWLIWDARRWAVDQSNRMRQKANEMARLLYLQAVRLPEGSRRKMIEKHALASESSRGITNALTEAERMEGIPVSAHSLDQYPDHLNFRNGTVRLRDGAIAAHDPAMLLTKLCDCNYNPAAKCPGFQVFVEWTMGGPVDGNPDAELPEMTVRLVSFLQRVIGYAITGSVSEKAVFVFYGAGGDNGKTTLLTIFRELLGRDYASLLLIDTIMHARSTDNTAREDMADLRGARFVQTSEVSKEDRLNEQRVKFLTQGMGTIKSRRLHEHLIEFIATHKLLMDCNYRPKVTGQDNAIWRRLIQIPFNFTIDESRKDAGLLARLKAEETEGILAWAVRGAIDWYRDGLGKPPEVAEAQQDWRENDDPLREFINDWCELGEELFCPVADLMTAYLMWSKEYGEKFPLPRRAFNEALVGKGIKQDRRRIEGEPTRIWVGIELKASASQKVRKVFVSEPRHGD